MNACRILFGKTRLESKPGFKKILEVQECSLYLPFVYRIYCKALDFCRSVLQANTATCMHLKNRQCATYLAGSCLAGRCGDRTICYRYFFQSIRNLFFVLYRGPKRRALYCLIILQPFLCYSAMLDPALWRAS